MVVLLSFGAGPVGPCACFNNSFNCAPNRSSNFFLKIAPFFVKGICCPTGKTSTRDQEIRSGGARLLFAVATARIIAGVLASAEEVPAPSPESSTMAQTTWDEVLRKLL